MNKKVIIGLSCLAFSTIGIAACGSSTGGTTATTPNVNNETSQSSYTSVSGTKTFKEAIEGKEPFIIYSGNLKLDDKPYRTLIFQNGSVTVGDIEKEYNEISQLSDSEIIDYVMNGENHSGGDVKVVILTDQTGKNVEAERIYFRDKSRDNNYNYIPIVREVNSGGFSGGEYSQEMLNSYWHSYNAYSVNGGGHYGEFYRESESGYIETDEKYIGSDGVTVVYSEDDFNEWANDYYN